MHAQLADFVTSSLSPILPTTRSHADQILTDNYRFLQQHILDELIDISSEYEQIQMNFALTSIHDHSLHDAFSRTLHKSIESLPYLEDLLNIFCYVRRLLPLMSNPGLTLRSVEFAIIQGLPV